MDTQKDLFDFLLKNVKDLAHHKGIRMEFAFPEWFAKLYFNVIVNFTHTDGSGDGKVDSIVECRNGDEIFYNIINSKYTAKYNCTAPNNFYDEISRFSAIFKNKDGKEEYLRNLNGDREKLYRKAMQAYDEGRGRLFFITNFTKNETQFSTSSEKDIKILHLNDLFQYLLENLEGAMPHTPDLTLEDISQILTPPESESAVPTNIVFAKLIDFIHYMQNDKLDLLFARNVRKNLGNTQPNKAIRITYEKNPDEFCYSNNGITILADDVNHDPSRRQLKIKNPRVVNGSQSLHSIRKAKSPTLAMKQARVMLKIVQIPAHSDVLSERKKRMKIIHAISIRTNMQNPIKLWNLVANDEYQNRIAQYFWRQGFYYERRAREYKERQLELKNAGIRFGIRLSEMVQLLSAYYYDQKYLGPAIAYGFKNNIFEEMPYAQISKADPQEVFVVFQLHIALKRVSLQLRQRYRFIENLKSSSYFASFSLFIKICTECGFIVRKLADTDRIASIIKGELDIKLSRILKLIYDQISREHRNAMALLGEHIPVNNYFKSQSYMSKLLDQRIQGKMASQLKVEIAGLFSN